jgi:S1-C subfamily serine protease
VDVKPNRLTASWSALLAFGALLASAPALRLAADTPAAAPDAARTDSSGDAEAQLAAARRQLEQAAHEVARLSEQISGKVIDQMMPLVETGHAIIGVQLDPAAGPSGARVREVSPGGPAAEAGIHAGDVIVGVNGQPVTGTAPARQVVKIMRDVKPDSRVTVRVLRDGKPREFVVTARAGPEFFAAFRGMPELGSLAQLHGDFMFHRPLGELELATLSPRLGSYFGSDKGVLVVRAGSDGPLKLEDGDVILAIDGREPTSGSHATRILGSYQPGEKVSLRILRQHKTLELESVLPERAGYTGMMQREGPLPEPASPHRTVIFGNGDI